MSPPGSAIASCFKAVSSSLSSSAPLRIPLPVPFPIGDVNAYLLRGSPVTLVDPGPRSPATLAALEAALAEHGLRIEDVELVVLTHQHSDHAGLAQIVRERARCPVAAVASVAELMADLDTAARLEDDYEMALLAFHGAPAEVIATVPPVSKAGREWLAAVAVDRVLHDGDVLHAGGWDYTVRLRPGHTWCDTLLLRADGVALVGDHLLANIAVAVLSHRPPAGPLDVRERPSAMLAYRASLAATAVDGPTVAHGGHGPQIDDPRALIARRLVDQQARADELLTVLADGAQTAWELVVSLWAGRAPRQFNHPVSVSFIALSDALASIDLLVDRGLVRALDGGGAVRFEAA